MDMRAPDIFDHLRDAVEHFRPRDFTTDELKFEFPELSKFGRREIIEALEGLSGELGIRNAGVAGRLWMFN